MNYYIQGNKEKADQIKAAFKKLGCDVTGFDMCNDNILFFTYKLEGGGKVISTTNANLYTADIIKTHPDYKELELPKPHYNIKNFKPFDKVLVRDEDDGKWMAAFYSHYMYEEKDYPYQFATIGTDIYGQCIPFEGNEHLFRTTDMCDEMYINW